MNSGEDSFHRWYHRRVPRHTSTRHRVFVAGFLLEDDFRSLRVVEVVKELAWAHNLWEECILPGGKTPRLAELQWLFALALSTWKKRFRTEYR